MAQINIDLETLKTARDNMKTALEEKGQTVTKDIRTYAEAISNIPTGGGDVKLFETVEEMQLDPSPNEGDLAIVYREEIQSIGEDSEFDSCIFPNTVVLNEAFTGSIYGSFRGTGSSYFNGMVDMSSSSFRFDGWGDGSRVRVQYTSNDGITYTRTDGGEELQEFGVVIKYDPMEPWNDVIGNFMKMGGNYFDGLYQYKINNHQDNVIQVADLTTYTTTMEDGHIKTFNVNDKLDMYFNLNDLKRVQEINNINYATFYVSTDNKLKMIIGQKYTYITNSSGNIIGLGTQNYNSSATPICEVYDVNLDDYSLSNYTTYAHNEFPLYTRKVSWYKILNMKSYIIDTSNSAQTYQAEIVTENVSYIGYSNVVDLNVFKNEYIISKNQLDATSDYVYEKTFYGKNGVENGTLGNSISTNFNDIVAGLYTKALISYENTPTKILVSKNEIDENIYIIPTKINGTSLLDFSQLTDTGAMFYDAVNFIGTEVFDIQSSTHCGNMFRGCKSLKILPIQLSTTNVTTMNGTFYDCINLTFIPNMDTSNVTTMWGICCNCINLVTVPVLNTSKVTVMENMFTNCSSLSNESLNNILYMCANANAYINQGTNMTLQYIGLSQEQAQICTTLSNYQAFVNAGWTTGY